MPPRLNKRQQREQEELLALGGALEVKHEEQSGSGEELAEEIAMPAGGTGFAALFTPGEDEHEASEEEEALAGPAKSKKSKKKKKKAAAASSQMSNEAESSADVPASDSTPAPPSQPKKSKKSKGKGKGKKEDSGDEVDKALAELSLKYPAMRQAAHTNASTSKSADANTLAVLLAVQPAQLDADAELKRFFGARVVSAAKSSSSSPSSRRAPTQAQKSVLTRPPASWYMAAKAREGLSVWEYGAEEVREKARRMGWVDAHGAGGEGDGTEGERWWTVEYSRKYKGVTGAFMQTVMSGDPEGFYRVLNVLPWHADTLLQLSEVARHREEYSTAVDYVARALFTYERAFVGGFGLTSGRDRLDFDRVENRVFFMALHRQVTDLQRRGCPRTAFAFARLLYALDPWTDPHGALLHLDTLAHRAGMAAWVLEAWAHFRSRYHADGEDGKKERGKGRMDPTVLPGWAYSRALAVRAQEDTRKDGNYEASTEALQEAILAFPSVVQLLADKAEISLSQEIRGHKAFRIETELGNLDLPTACLHMLSHLYAQRAATLWKDPTLASWFSSTLSALPLASLSSPNPTRAAFLRLYASPHIRHSAYRHVYVLESTTRRLFAFIPKAVLDARQVSADPLPPPSAVSVYDAAFFEGAGAEDVFVQRVQRRRGGAEERRMLEQLVPDPVFRRQLQAFFDAHPGFAARFPGGIVQFAQVAGQLPEEVLEDLMIAEAGGAGGEGRMPGEMPMQEEVELVFNQGREEEAGDEGGPDVVVDDTPLEDVEEPHGGDDDAGEDEEEEEEYVAPMPVRVVRNLINRFWGGGTAAAAESSDEE